MPKDLKENKKKMVVVEEVSPEPVEVNPEPESKVEVKPEVQESEVKAAETQALPPVEPVDEDQEKTNYLWIIIPTALLIGALVGGLITYFSGISKLSSNPTPTQEPTIEPASVSPTPSASPSASVKRDLIKLQVLNGSGVSGLAGKAKTYLEGLGYKDVQTGNASKSDLLETTVSLKDSKKDMLDTVVADLSKNYKVAKETETLPSSSKYDFVITLGSK